MNTLHFSWQQTLKKYSGDEKIAGEIVSLFFKELPAARQRIQQAFENNSPEELSQALHRLKGSCCFVSVPALQKLVADFYQVSLSCSSDKLRDFQLLHENFNHEVSRLLAHQKEFYAHGSA
jgi:HPt (histidine-containing phosphotransfer) domain-containing protein